MAEQCRFQRADGCRYEVSPMVVLILLATTVNLGVSIGNARGTKEILDRIEQKIDLLTVAPETSR